MYCFPAWEDGVGVVDSVSLLAESNPEELDEACESRLDGFCVNIL